LSLQTWYGIFFLMIRRKKTKKTLIRFCAAALAGIAAAGTILLSGCGAAANESYTKTGTYFDTVITVAVYGKQNQKYLKGCFDLAGHYEKLLSNTIRTSDISRINDAGGKYVTVDSDTIEVLKDALYYCRKSQGAFDITIGKTADLWDFADNKGTIPADSKIRDTVSHVNYRNISIRGQQAALKDAKAEIDLGAIAKGFIADKMKAYLEKNNVSSAIINLGGNVLLVGSKPDGSSYKVGVEKPFQTEESLGTLTLSDKSVVTSGVYQRYFKKNGIIYHHILNTRTGYPVSNQLYSVTIISDSSTQGDGLSTTCFALGLKKGMRLIEQTDGVEAIFVTSDYRLHTTSGIGTAVSFQPES
jgi:thiamine biosynthesis lipoprotein